MCLQVAPHRMITRFTEGRFLHDKIYLLAGCWCLCKVCRTGHNCSVSGCSSEFSGYLLGMCDSRCKLDV